LSQQRSGRGARSGSHGRSRGKWSGHVFTNMVTGTTSTTGVIVDSTPSTTGVIVLIPLVPQV